MSKRTVLNDAQVAALIGKYPELPSEYIAYLRSEGWGEAQSGRMIYEGPMFPDEIYGDNYNGPNVLLLGDDFQGYCFAYNPETKSYGEISDSGDWEPWPNDEGFVNYVKSEE